MRCVGLITARGGSKGIPKKNIVPVANKPLIGWTIDAALASGSLDRTIVSTDCPEIAAIASGFGAEVPFLRPPELAKDDSPHNAVIRHAIEWLSRDEGSVPDYVVLLQPTCPLRTPEDIDAAIALAREKNADSVISVFAIQHHPYWTRRMGEDGRLDEFMKWSDQASYLQRQVLPKAYALNGAIYVINSQVYLDKNTYLTDRTFGYVMPAERSLDIDTPWDLHIVDLVMRDMNASK